MFYLPGLVIEHSWSFFDNYRLTLVIDIPKFTQFSFIYLWTEQLVVGIVKLRHERAFLSHSNWFFFHWFKGSKIESYFMTAKMFESDTSEITSVISDLVRAEITVSIVNKKLKIQLKLFTGVLLYDQLIVSLQGFWITHHRIFCSLRLQLVYNDSICR